MSSIFFLDSSSLEEAESSSEVSRSLREARKACFSAFLREVLPLDVLLVDLLVLGVMLAEGVLALVLALAGVVLFGRVLGGVILVLLGAVGDVVVRVSTRKAPFLRATTTTLVQPVVVKPGETTDHERQIIIAKSL